MNADELPNFARASKQCSGQRAGPALAHFFRVAETTKQRLLKEAAKVIGVEELANRLGVPSWLLVAWIAGRDPRRIRATRKELNA